MILLNKVQDFEMGSVTAGMPWVCAKQVFRSYLGNEERSVDEVDGGFDQSYYFEREQGMHKSNTALPKRVDPWNQNNF